MAGRAGRQAGRAWQPEWRDMLVKTRHRASWTFDAVRAIGFSLPETEECTYYGGPALKVRGKVFACMATNKVAEPNTLVVWTDESARDELISAQPDVYYLKDHYVGYQPVVLVRLSRIDHAALRDLLVEAHQIVKASAPKRGGARPTAAGKSRIRRRAGSS